MSSNKSSSIKTANNPASNPEVIKVAANVDQIACDGGHPTLGHPVTYYTFDDGNTVECGYCDRQFVKKSK